MIKVKIHNVKLEGEYFKRVVSGEKNYEIRLNDRDYKQGDIIVLHELCVRAVELTGKRIIKEIGFITGYEQKEGYIVMALLNLTNKGN